MKRKPEGVEKIILVGSGKGGVGKSTVSANLSVALAKFFSLNVGLLDADFYGPSIPVILGLNKTVVTVGDNRKIIPISKFGIKVISLGLLLPNEDTPVIWRGPLLMKAINQFLFEVDWGNLDVLVIDLPPGTGDVQLSIAQTVETDGALVITTPQDVSLSDVRKAVSMFEELKIPVLGIVENMAYFKCPNCGSVHYIFGKGRIEDYCAQKDIPLIAKLPLEPLLSEKSDKGIPIVIEKEKSDTAKGFMEIAEFLYEKLFQ